MNGLAITPLLIHLATCMVGLVLWKRPGLQRAASLVGMALGFAAACLVFSATRGGEILVLYVGGWAAPYGITMVADHVSGIMVLVNAVVGLSAIVYSLGNLDRARASFGFHPMTHALLASVAGVFLAGDLFNVYVWFEIMLLSSFVLLALGGERPQVEAAVKYVALNLLSSTLFLAAIGLLYGMTGTLNIADLAFRLQHVGDPKTLTALALLFLVAFGIKAGTFPFFYWLPASYHTPPAVVGALFAGVMTKVGVYAVVRFFPLFFMQEPGVLYRVLLWISGITMVVGVLGAASQMRMRRILAFHSVSQVGYMLMGVAVFGVAQARLDAGGLSAEAAAALKNAQLVLMAGTFVFIFHHAIVKMNLFLVSGIVMKHKGTDDLHRVGGLYAERPWLGLLFMVPAMSLAGIPVLSGFWGKLALVRGGVQAGAFPIVLVSLFVSVLTLFSMVKIWNYAFWRPQAEADAEGHEAEPDEAPAPAADMTPWKRSAMVGASVFLAAGAVLMGLFPGAAYRSAETAARQLLGRDAYIAAVLPAEHTDGWLELLRARREGATAPAEAAAAAGPTALAAAAKEPS